MPPGRAGPDAAPRLRLVPDRPGRPPGRWSALRPDPSRPVLGLAAAAALIAVLYSVSLHVVAGSDGATVVLQGRAIASGNPALHGWALSTDSFWSIDAPVYAVVVLITGVQPYLLHLVPAVIAAAVIVVAAGLARTALRGRAALVASVAVVAVLGTPGPAFAASFLLGPLHVGTTLWCLIAFAGLRSGRFGWGWVVAVVFLAAGLLGDLQVALIAVVPIGAAGLATAVRTRRWSAGGPAMAAVVGGVALAAVVRMVMVRIGTYSIATAHARASRSQALDNVTHIPAWGAQVLGVGDAVYGDGGVPAGLQAVHLVAAAAVVAGIAGAGYRLVRGLIERGPSRRPGSLRRVEVSDWFLDDVLVLAVAADLVLFAYLTVSDDRSYERYLTAGAVFGAILAGRLLGRRTDDRSGPGRGVAAVGGLAVAALAAGLGFQLAAPVPPQPYSELAGFLAGHGLRSGIGDYWSASITTVYANTHVTVRPVIADPRGRLVRYQKQSASGWYAGRPFRFLVYDAAAPWGGVDARRAQATFGPPEHTYTVGPYRVLVWSRPVTVSPDGDAP